MAYHCDNVAQSLTTNEKLKKTYRLRTNPNDKGLSQNCMHFWCRTIRPSYVSSGGARGKEDDIPLEMPITGESGMLMASDPDLEVGGI